MYFVLHHFFPLSQQILWFMTVENIIWFQASKLNKWFNGGSLSSYYCLYRVVVCFYEWSCKNVQYLIELCLLHLIYIQIMLIIEHKLARWKSWENVQRRVSLNIVIICREDSKSVDYTSKVIPIIVGKWFMAL